MDHKKNNFLVASGVIITDQGERVLGFAKFLRMETVDLTEAWSLQIGLQIAINLNIKKI